MMMATKDIISECLKQLPDIDFSANNFEALPESQEEPKATEADTVAVPEPNMAKNTTIINKIHNKNPYPKCELCNIVLNSPIVYEKHLKGQKHLKKAGESTKVVVATTCDKAEANAEAENNTEANAEAENNTVTNKPTTSKPNHFLSCDICKIKVPTQFNLDLHLAGKKHKSIMAKMSMNTSQNQNGNETMEVNREIPAAENNTEANSEAENKQNHFLPCDICKIKVPTQYHLDLHLNGKKHKSIMAKMSMNTSQNPNGNEMMEVNRDMPAAENNTEANAEAESKPNHSLSCDICKIKVPTQFNLDLHLAGKKHKSIMAKMSMNTSQNQNGNETMEVNREIPAAENNTEANSEAENKQNHFLPCDICKIKVPTQYHLDLHLNGKKHKSIMAKMSVNTSENETMEVNQETSVALPVSAEAKQPKKAAEEVKCEVCNIVMVSQVQLDSHLAGKKHAKKLKEPAGGGDAEAMAGNDAKESEDEKFAHLNIAWDKYKVANQMISLPDVPTQLVGDKSVNYEFYCAMCKKFMQRKLQLVDVSISGL